MSVLNFPRHGLTCIVVISLVCIVCTCTVVQVVGPPECGAYKSRPLEKPTGFRKYYERGDFPIALDHDTRGNKIAWKVGRGTACWISCRIKMSFWAYLYVVPHAVLAILAGTIGVWCNGEEAFIYRSLMSMHFITALEPETEVEMLCRHENAHCIRKAACID